MKTHLAYLNLMSIDLKNGLNKNIKLLLISLLFPISINSQNNEMTRNLPQKKINTITTYSCNPEGIDCFIHEKKYFNQNGNHIKTEEFSLNEVYKTITNYYNQQNRLDSVVVNLSNNNQKNYTSTYKYDLNGKLIEEVTKSVNNIKDSTEFIYNQDGQLIIEIHKSNNQKIIEKNFFYDDSKNNYKETIKYFPEEDEEVILKYYSQNNLLEKIVYQGHTETYIYSNHKLIQKNFLNKINEIEDIEIHKYKNDLIESSIVKNSNNEISMYFKYEYNFYD